MYVRGIDNIINIQWSGCKQWCYFHHFLYLESRYSVAYQKKNCSLKETYVGVTELKLLGIGSCADLLVQSRCEAKATHSL